MSSTAKVKVSSFLGCSRLDIRDHIKPLLQKNPDEIVIYFGTNSLQSCTSVHGSTEEIVDLASMIRSGSSVKVAIFGLVARSEVNKILKQFSNQNGWGS